MQRLENILIVGPSWIGDMVMAQPLFNRLAKFNSGCRISVLAPEWTKPILSRMSEVDQALESPFKHGDLQLLNRRKYGVSLRQHDFDAAVILPNSFKSALIPFHAGIPVRIGWQGEMRNLLLSDCRRLNKINYPRMVERFVSLAYPANEHPPSDIPYPVLEVDKASCDLALKKFRLETNARIVALCPGAEFGPAKQWPAQHFSSLCRKLIEKGWQVWIFGSNKDTGISSQIVSGLSSEHAESCIDLCGRTDIGEVTDLLSLATVAVSNDSGLMHIAAAVKTPVVGIYGSTSPGFTPPLGERVSVVNTDIDCRPCFQRECPLGHTRCLSELEPDRVLGELMDLLNDNSEHNTLED